MPAIDYLSTDVWDAIRGFAIRDATTDLPVEARLWNLALVNCAFRDAVRATKYTLLFERVLGRCTEITQRVKKRESDRCSDPGRVACTSDAVTLHACSVAHFFIGLHKIHSTNLFESALEISYAAARACIDNVGDMAQVLDSYQDALGKIIRCPPLAGKLLDELGQPDDDEE